MTFEEMRHRVTIASALGLLLLASSSDSQTVAAAIEESTMTLPRQYTTPASARPIAAAQDTAIRPFQIHVPEAELVELRRRIMTTRWPEKETVADHSQGVPLAMIRELARHWATDYDWRKAEAKLNAFPHFVTNIDGLDIHFIHARSKHANALPLIVTHGWPGSIIEQLKIYFNEADRGGHFAAWEQPELFAKELRAAFKSLR